jgi:hypothetical protein
MNTSSFFACIITPWNYWSDVHQLSDFVNGGLTTSNYVRAEPSRLTIIIPRSLAGISSHPTRVGVLTFILHGEAVTKRGNHGDFKHRNIEFFGLSIGWLFRKWVCLIQDGYSELISRNIFTTKNEGQCKTVFWVKYSWIFIFCFLIFKKYECSSNEWFYHVLPLFSILKIHRIVCQSCRRVDLSK